MYLVLTKKNATRCSVGNALAPHHQIVHSIKQTPQKYDSSHPGLKALFRPMTVMVPDLVLICENMLMAEGFIEAKVSSLAYIIRQSLHSSNQTSSSETPVRRTRD